MDAKEISMKKKMLGAVMVLVATVVVSAQGYAEVTTCAGESRDKFSGHLGGVELNMDTASPTYGITLRVAVSSATTSLVQVPFSFPQFDVVYAEILQVQKNGWKIQGHRDADAVLCDMVVWGTTAVDSPVTVPDSSATDATGDSSTVDSSVSPAIPASPPNY